NTPELRAVLIDGPWGTGKTYFAKDFIERNSSLLREAGLKPGYASLVGAESVADVRTRLALSALPKAKLGQPLKNLKLSIAGIELGGLGEMSRDYAQDFLLRQMFVCLDDFERRAAGLRVVDLMGFVAELIEDR